MATPLKVLIIENAEDDAFLMVDHLSQAGYQVQWKRVETPAALRAALTPPAPWHLILSDYSMPGFSGLAAAEIYKRSGLDIPFILISGSIGEERAVDAMRAGVHDYIMKDRMKRLPPAVDRELREAANRQQRRLAVAENHKLTADLATANEALRRKIEQLSRSHQDLEQVASAASHDLKEPLRAVTMYSQLLVRRRAASDPDEMEFSRYIWEGVERARALIDGLRAFCGNSSAGDLSAECDADSAAKVAAAKGLQASGGEIFIEPLPAVRIERGALLEVFEHLFHNGLQFSRDGVAPQVRVSYVRDGSNVRFAVADNGIGIKPEHHERIFELFRRLHGEEQPGVGVGLTLCRRTIEKYGGRMWLESELGAGSTFYFTLSAAERRSNATAS